MSRPDDGLASSGAIFEPLGTLSRFKERNIFITIYPKYLYGCTGANSVDSDQAL